MFDWLSDNKEWLFSGLGLVVLAGLYSLAKRIWTGGTQKLPEHAPRKRAFQRERLADAFTLGAVVARVTRAVETKGASAIPPRSWQTLRTLTKRLGLGQALPVPGSPPVSLLDDFPQVSHRIEKTLQQGGDARLRNAFMLGNFIGVSSLAPSTALRNEALARAEVFARDMGLSGAFLTSVFAQLRSIPSGPEADAKIGNVLNVVHDEIQRL